MSHDPIFRQHSTKAILIFQKTFAIQKTNNADFQFCLRGKSNLGNGRILRNTNQNHVLIVMSTIGVEGRRLTKGSQSYRMTFVWDAEYKISRPHVINVI